MHSLIGLSFVWLLAQNPPQSGPRSLEWDGVKRTYHVHVPKNYDHSKPTPVVLALHGAGMNGPMMERFSGLSAKADEAGFVVVYPSGTGAGVFLTWNAGFFPGPLNKKKADDVGFLNKLLDELPSVVNVDPRRIYVAGMSNGGMMSYRVGAELSHRIAAIAPVTGVLVLKEWAPKHPMPVLHIHGTDDLLVPFTGGKKETPEIFRFPSIEETVLRCVKANGCSEAPMVTELPQAADTMKVTRKLYPKGSKEAEVVLYIMNKGGHVWPGQPNLPFLGESTKNVIANDVIWEFFSRYQRILVKQ